MGKAMIRITCLAVSHFECLDLTHGAKLDHGRAQHGFSKFGTTPGRFTRVFPLHRTKCQKGSINLRTRVVHSHLPSSWTVLTFCGRTNLVVNIRLVTFFGQATQGVSSQIQEEFHFSQLRGQDVQALWGSMGEIETPSQFHLLPFLAKGRGLPKSRNKKRGPILGILECYDATARRPRPRKHIGHRNASSGDCNQGFPPGLDFVGCTLFGVQTEAILGQSAHESRIQNSVAPSCMIKTQGAKIGFGTCIFHCFLCFLCFPLCSLICYFHLSFLSFVCLPFLCFCPGGFGAILIHCLRDPGRKVGESPDRSFAVLCRIQHVSKYGDPEIVGFLWLPFKPPRSVDSKKLGRLLLYSQDCNWAGGYCVTHRV